ncbi:MAG: hypothetical protein RR036_01820 [Oscillospiraceae bacterium]
MNKQTDSLFKRVRNCFILYIGCFFVSLITCIGLSLIMTTPLLQFFVGCLTLMVFSIPLYTKMWTLGNSDHNKVTFGHIKENNFLGFKIGLLASTPMFILALLLIPAKLEVMTNFLPLYKILNVQVWPFLNLIEPKNYMIDNSWIEIIIMMLFSLVPSIITGVGYVLGLHDISPSQKIMYKRKNGGK